jgi:hypothetical protein
MPIILLLSALLAAPKAPFRAPSPARITSARWDATGHRAIAAIAYARLRPATRARVDALLRRHPDLDSLARGLDMGAPDTPQELFLRASIWPDGIRRDPRFFTETDTAAAPVPLLPGYPDMARHASWHYLSRSFATDGTPTLLLQTPNALTAMAGFADALGDTRVPESVRAYGLVWLIHVIGDLHQPLHGTSRSNAAHPTGDAGGNGEWVQMGPQPTDTVNLHAVWDGLLGQTDRDVPAPVLAQRLTSALPIAPGNADLVIPAGAALAGAIGTWADESATLARYLSYNFQDRAAGSAPPVLTPAYVQLAQSVGRQRVVLAGYRLAAVIEARLGGP